MTTIEIYRSYGRWLYALRVDGEFERLGTVGIDDEASVSKARDAVQERFSHLGEMTVTRAADLP